MSAHKKQHGLGNSDNHSTATLAELNALVSDGHLAVLDAVNDGYLNAENLKTRGFDRLNPDTMGVPSYTVGTRTFALAVKGGETEFHFWANGVKFTKTTTQSVIWPDTSGTYYFYFDTSGVLQYVINTDMSAEIFFPSAICGLVTFNKAEGTAWGAIDEQHGIDIPPSVHFRMHLVDKFKHAQGGEITGLESGESDYDGISASVHFDEDIYQVSSASTTHKFMYREGADGF